MRAPQNSATRATSALALSAFVGAHLGVALHDAVVEHVRCAEHGELVDAQAAPTETAAGEPQRAGAHLASTGSSGPSKHAGHDHCTVFAAARGPLWVDSGNALAIAQGSRPPLPRAAADAHSPVDTQWLAPKTSPPLGVLL